MAHNSLRLAHVWMDEYKVPHLQARPLLVMSCCLSGLPVCPFRSSTCPCVQSYASGTMGTSASVWP